MTTPYDPIPPNPVTPLNPPGPSFGPPPVVPPPLDPPVVVQRWFSPGTRGFYSSDNPTAPPPLDAVPITNVLWQQLLDENMMGREIVFDVGTQLPVTIVPQVTFQAIFGQFTSRLRATDWTQLQDTPPQIRNLFRNYRDDLRTLMQNLPPNLNNVVWPAVPPINDPLFVRSLSMS